MPAADDHLPFVRADAQAIAVPDAAIGVGQAMNHPAEITEFRLVALQFRGIPARGPIEIQAGGRRSAARIGGDDPARQVFETAHPQRDLESFRQPACQAAMVRVHVSDHDPGRRASVHGTCENRLPGLEGLRCVQPGIDQCPAVLLLDGPGVDPLQRPEQRHSQPQHPRCDRDEAAITGLRLRCQRVLQSHRLP